MISKFLKTSTTCALAGLVTCASTVVDKSVAAEAVKRSQVKQFRVYVGTYTKGTSKGIYLSHLDVAAGVLSEAKLVAETDNPSFLAIDPSHRFLYAVGEVGNFGGRSSGAVIAYSIDAATGDLTELNQQASMGASPCHLVVDATGKNVLVANYGGGSVAALPIRDDGRLGRATAFVQHAGSSVNPRRQQGPHAHSINLDAASRFAVAADLGLDKILVYRFDSKQGTLTANDPPSVSVAPGAGPRHFAFHPNGRFAYVINELALTVTAFGYAADRGVLTPIQSLPTVPKDADRKGLSTAEVQVHPSGKFLYGSNRGHNTIVVFRINRNTGKLTHVENESTGGKTPRNFAIDPTGSFLLAENQASDSIVVFRIDQKSGALHPTGQKVDVPSPVCVKMMPAPR